MLTLACGPRPAVGAEQLAAARRAGHEGGRGARGALGRAHRNRRRPGARRPNAGRHRPDDRAGRLGRRLHRFQRLQFRAKARLDPGHARRRLAARGQAGGHRPQPHAGAAEDRNRGQAARARGRAAWPRCASASGRSPSAAPSKPSQPNVSVGIVSALDRIWGKAIQTDAKISPNNYGGPLVDIAGRVLGVLVPMSPDGSGEVAGVEWYDSGIGFAVPLEDRRCACCRGSRRARTCSRACWAST